MQIVAIDRYVATCEAQGVCRDVSLFMMTNTDLAVGDYVMVHVGYAIQKMTHQDARTVWDLLDQIVAAGAV
jgi:hydrogenase expression/formation protein HypC